MHQVIGLVLAVLRVKGAVLLAPLLWMVNVSFQTNAEEFASPFGFPQVMQLGNYIFAWTKGYLGKAMFNSLLVCGIALIVSMFLGSMASLAIARK